MDRKKTVKLLIILSAAILAAPAGAEEKPVLQTKKEKMSYGAGVQMGRSLKAQGIELDSELVIRGFRDAFAGKELLMSGQELSTIVNALQAEARKKEVETRHQRAKSAAENKKAGETFLAENAKKEGVVALPSGLQYKILKSGEGRKPGDTDTVEVHYRGSHIDGRVFDSSYEKGKPANFKVTGGVIPGFSEALKLMPVGSKWQVFIPARLGYGERGSGREIAPGETLVFELELLAIK